MQHRRAGLRRRVPSLGWALLAGLGARAETGRAEPPLAMPAPRPGSRALRRGTRTSPRWRWQREGAPGRSPAAGHGKASSSLCRFPLFLPPFGFWQRSRGGGWGTRCRGRAAKRRQPPKAPRPPVPRLVAGRRAACAWRGSVSCGRIPAPRSLPISLRAGTAGGSGGTGGEGWGGRIVKGREEEKKKTKQKENNGHMPSLERRGCRCQNASRQRGAKTRRRQRGGSGSPFRRGTRGGRAARRRHGMAKAGRVADGEAGEERAPPAPTRRQRALARPPRAKPGRHQGKEPAQKGNKRRCHAKILHHPDSCLLLCTPEGPRLCPAAPLCPGMSSLHQHHQDKPPSGSSAFSTYLLQEPGQGLSPRNCCSTQL
ncbi:uncharacterized protein LOC142362797 [Opisthocomus hoazin]|uniref:uncharacterized protein LOC142362797 n=1 Tax=Opisthocomus hoazin TaxID=30419 RepID=UPI003F538C02